MNEKQIAAIANLFIGYGKGCHKYAWYYIREEQAKELFEHCIRITLQLSAAPEMLAALKKARITIVNGLESDGDMEALWSKEDKALLVEIDAAIAKAKGE